MSKLKNEVASKRANWSTPRLEELESDLGDVQNGFAPGNDGAGGANTSLS
nr:hypothetical protein [uncultured Erythrobacter sp.]